MISSEQNKRNRKIQKLMKTINLTVRYDWDMNAANNSNNKTGNSTGIKMTADGHQYVSSQMVKHAILKSMSHSEKMEYMISVGEIQNPDILQDVRSDMFGYLIPVKGVGSASRKSCLCVGSFMSEEPVKTQQDMLVRYNVMNSGSVIDNKYGIAFGGKTSPSMATIELSTGATMCGTFTIDSWRAGLFFFPKIDKNGHQVNWNTVAAYDVDEKRNRIAATLHGICNMKEFAKTGSYSVASKPSKLFISFDNTVTSHPDYFKLSDEDKAIMVEEIESKGGKVFIGESYGQSIKALNSALEYVEDVEIEHPSLDEVVENKYISNPYEFLKEMNKK